MNDSISYCLMSECLHGSSAPMQRHTADCPTPAAVAIAFLCTCYGMAACAFCPLSIQSKDGSGEAAPKAWVLLLLLYRAVFARSPLRQELVAPRSLMKSTPEDAPSYKCATNDHHRQPGSKRTWWGQPAGIKTASSACCSKCHDSTPYSFFSCARCLAVRKKSCIAQPQPQSSI